MPASEGGAAAPSPIARAVQRKRDQPRYAPSSIAAILDRRGLRRGGVAVAASPPAASPSARISALVGDAVRPARRRQPSPFTSNPGLKCPVSRQSRSRSVSKGRGRSRSRSPISPLPAESAKDAKEVTLRSVGWADFVAAVEAEEAEKERLKRPQPTYVPPEKPYVPRHIAKREQGWSQSVKVAPTQPATRSIYDDSPRPVQPPPPPADDADELDEAALAEADRKKRLQRASMYSGSQEHYPPSLRADVEETLQRMAETRGGGAGESDVGAPRKRYDRVTGEAVPCEYCSPSDARRGVGSGEGVTSEKLETEQRLRELRLQFAKVLAEPDEVPKKPRGEPYNIPMSTKTIHGKVVEVPEVDDLLAELNAVVPAAQRTGSPIATLGVDGELRMAHGTPADFADKLYHKRREELVDDFQEMLTAATARGMGEDAVVADEEYATYLHRLRSRRPYLSPERFMQQLDESLRSPHRMTPFSKAYGIGVRATPNGQPARRCVVDGVGAPPSAEMEARYDVMAIGHDAVMNSSPVRYRSTGAPPVTPPRGAADDFASGLEDHLRHLEWHMTPPTRGAEVTGTSPCTGVAPVAVPGALYSDPFVVVSPDPRSPPLRFGSKRWHEAVHGKKAPQRSVQ
eukprot:TRINITY_DN3010_c0_g3_i1.p1 TRINITY_DN3010_c0_g3~~TRINITY_DN3010_c0_g3_i1.p1  ORF type:complete len:629 (+),score=169.75 TRINITY_DN3010_c0_g3_i1:78-1964(+)